LAYNGHLIAWEILKFIFKKYKIMHNIYPCLWFDGNAKEAATFYCSVFNNSMIISDNGMVVMFQLESKKIMGLNGGPMYSINPSISFFVTCATIEEIESIWNRLIEGGTVMMPLDKYPWGEKYGFVKDRFGMTWQLIFTTTASDNQKIMMSMLFVGKQFGKAEEAIKYYSSLFPNSSIISTKLIEEGRPQPAVAGTLEFGQFNLGNEKFVAMDGAGNHQFQFNEGISFVVECDTQQEIDNYWNTLTKDGNESMCGWLKDRYGVSWQIIPSILNKLMSDTEKAPRVMQAFMKMKKFDIETLMMA
jgi:predicted 3-demethylubiquinone-9 3-methyltransferase (glyoxalase superfamily)